MKEEKKLKEKFDKWNDVKKNTSLDKRIELFFEEREIWFIKTGQNIGVETNGKNEEFLRPFLIFRKFSKKSFLGIPLTRTEKKSIFYHLFKFKNEISNAMLSQIRLIDTKRLKYKLGKISKRDFSDIKEKFIELIQ